jgi:hypothetical protein
MITNELIVTVIGKIRIGAGIMQDLHWGEWPNCVPPRKEYEGEEYKYLAKNPDMLFEASWNGRYWSCKADGYGHLKFYGDAGDYGNGSIFVYGFSSVDIVKVLSGELPNEI